MSAITSTFIMMLVMLSINYTTMFLSLPRRFSIPVSIAIPIAFTVVINLVLYKAAGIENMFGGPRGLVHFPVIILLFKGQFFQKLFAFFLQMMFTAVQSFFAGIIAGFFIPAESESYYLLRLILVCAMLMVYCVLIFFHGRHIFQKLFIHGRTSDWALYAFGALFSFFIAIISGAMFTGFGQIMILLFILWSFAILCFAIINTHEKSKKSHEAETLTLQMSAMRNQIGTENKYRSDMDILRHNMRHEMNVIMELFHSGKSIEAEKVYETWLNSLEEAVPPTLCAEPVLNAVLSLFERRAKDAGINMLVSSQLPDSLTIDTVKLSIVLSNALENALAAAGNAHDTQRFVNVKFIYTGKQLGLEVVNTCTLPVEFDEKGYPITHKPGHGVGVRSIVAFAEENNCLLDFNYDANWFTLQLIMRV